MKKITFLLFITFISYSIKAQTIAWSSNSEDTTGWGVFDSDGDGNNWGFYSGGAEGFGFNSGALFYSESWSSDPAPTGTALTPDNYLFTPTFLMPLTATTITFKMKVAALDSDFPSEKFAVYVYDDNDLVTPETLIYQETLLVGGAGTAKDITASIPATFAGKTLGVIIRHFETTDQNQLLIDDFEVSYSTTLSVNDENQFKISGVYPNPVTDFVEIKTNSVIDAVSITNQLGQRILEIKKTGILNNRIDLTSLSKGIYFMNVSIENKLQSIKIIKN